MGKREPEEFSMILYTDLGQFLVTSGKLTDNGLE